MLSNDQSKSQSSHFVERLLGAAGGAILAGALGIWIFSLFKEAVPNEVIAVIAGVAGGAIARLQRKWDKQKKWGERE